MTACRYSGFIDEFTKGLKEKHPDVGFYIYGSFARGEQDPRKRSDIDGGIILDSGVVTDKEEIMAVSRLLARCLTNNRVNLQFNLTDRQTNKDGRFLSYTEDYTDYLKESSRVYQNPEFVRRSLNNSKFTKEFSNLSLEKFHFCKLL